MRKATLSQLTLKEGAPAQFLGIVLLYRPSWHLLLIAGRKRLLLLRYQHCLSSVRYLGLTRPITSTLLLQ
jgi:hypothetical protein